MTLHMVGEQKTTCSSFILSFHHVSSGDRTQDRLGDKYFIYWATLPAQVVFLNHPF